MVTKPQAKGEDVGLGSAETPESWAAARNLTQKLGYIPSSFSVAIRLLVSDQFENNANLRPVTKFQVARILGTPTFLAMLYYATKEMRAGYISGKKVLTVGAMMDHFDPIDLAAMICCLLYYRKCRKFMGPDRWPKMATQIALEAHFGCQVGVAVPEIGIGAGLIMGSLRHFALTAMALQNEGAFHDYTISMKMKGITVDEELERKKWGCTSRQIGVYLLSNVSFGVDIANGYSTAMDPTAKWGNRPDQMMQRMMAAYTWIRGLMSGNNQPREKLPAVWFPAKGDIPAFEAELAVIRRGKSHWLNRTKEEISRELSPELYSKKTAAPAEMEVPEELANVFSLEDITAMEEEEFDNLIDQMDREKEGKTKPGQVSLSSKDIQELEKMVDD